MRLGRLATALCLAAARSFSEAPAPSTDQFFVAGKLGLSNVGPGGGVSITSAHDWLLMGFSVDATEEIGPVVGDVDPRRANTLVHLQVGYGDNGRLVSRQILLGWTAANFVRRGAFLKSTGGEGCEYGPCGTTEHYEKVEIESSGPSLAGRVLLHGSRAGIGLEGLACLTPKGKTVQGNILFVWGLMRSPREKPLRFW
ncbi:MAG TPA: hypothetical protein PKY05_13265 [Fibrobacteria bacterium]|nr:hypothetical protein [Fibrobacteria bacterium]